MLEVTNVFISYEDVLIDYIYCNHLFV